MRISDWSSDVCSSDLGEGGFSRGRKVDLLDRLFRAEPPAQIRHRRPQAARILFAGKYRQPVLPGFFYQGGDGRGHRRRRGYRRRQAFLHVDHTQRLARGGALDSAWRTPPPARGKVKDRTRADKGKGG